MQKICPNCNNLFRGGDKVRAVIISEWVDLKSKVTYALGKPEECLEVAHVNCNYPQSFISEDYV